jgi:DNA-binding IclR family transcriptional regulator
VTTGRRLAALGATLAAVAILGALPALTTRYGLLVAFEIAQLAALAQAWNLMAGYGGMVSLAVAAFVGAAPGGIQAIARTAEILRVLRAAPDGITQAGFCEQIGLARSTVHRLLQAMRNEGLVETSGPRGRYRLGPAIRRLAEAAWRSSLGGLHPLLEELARQLNETVDLSVLERDRATIVGQISSSQRLRAVSTIGESVPLYCTASGKAFLAAMDQAGVARALPPALTRLTAATITDRSVLEAELALTRVRGYALDREEHSERICAVGIFAGLAAGVPAAVSVRLPAHRFYGREQDIGRLLLAWAERVRTQLPGPLRQRFRYALEPGDGMSGVLVVAPGERVGVDEPQAPAGLGEAIATAQRRHGGPAVVDDLDQDAVGRDPQRDRNRPALEARVAVLDAVRDQL